jgi:long-chain acyl-CoA synthetase
MGMGDILRRSAFNFPWKQALVYGENVITYHALNTRVNRLANSLLKMGIRKGDRLAVLFHNCPEFVEVYFAAAKIGAIFVPLDNLLKGRELEHIIKYVSPRYLFVDPDYEEFIGSIRKELPFIEKFIGLRGLSSTHLMEYDSMIEQGESSEPEIHISDSDVMTIILTTGTTGMPKGVMRTHRHNFVNAMIDTIELNVRFDDRTIFLTPPYHVTTEAVFGRHILMANTIYILREGSFNPKAFLDILSREKITMFQIVPTMIMAMLGVENIHTYDLSSLRLILYAASPIQVALLKRAIQTFKCQFMQMYGQTESGPLITVLRPEDHVAEGSPAQLAKLASAGLPVLDYEVRVVDEKGKDVNIGEVGEIIARGEAMTIGYWDLPDETSKILRDGWLHTGDMGRLDEDGYLYIVDRKNDMIISGGQNIYPREVEDVLLQHEAVQEAAVIGVPDEYWGESVKAVVVLKKGATASGEGLIDFCKTRLASYKKPRTVEFRDALPKSATGKTLKKFIKSEFWKGTDRNV